ncbi:DUF735 family protein [Candidatus Borreliella tachyglossi]|uniref:DUF735 family protein n=1 Tax=Candidatus Borreliella tachyglossi TaxID=1964448 RepID=UPI0040425228
MMLPNFLRNTQVEKFIQNELHYAHTILSELKELNSNFIDFDAKEHVNSRFIAFKLSIIFRIFYSRSQTLASLTNNINSVIFAKRHIGTDESFVRLFKAFLNVDVQVSTESAGVISIKLKGSMTTNFITYVSPSTPRGVRPKRIIMCTTKEGYARVCKKLVFNFLPKGYSHSIYAFIKELIPIGRVLKLYDKEDQELITFNN